MGVCEEQMLAPVLVNFKKRLSFNLNNCCDLMTGELDLVILALVQAFSRYDSDGSDRSRNFRCRHQFQFVPTCKEMFLHLYSISDSHLCNFGEHYK